MAQYKPVAGNAHSQAGSDLYVRGPRNNYSCPCIMASSGAVHQCIALNNIAQETVAVLHLLISERPVSSVGRASDF